jgi:hypothetical protein
MYDKLQAEQYVRGANIYQVVATSRGTQRQEEMPQPCDSPSGCVMHE